MGEIYCLVITTINPPTRAVAEIARDAHRLQAKFVLIGDSKSPADFAQPGATYLSLEAQRSAGFRYGEIVPVRHYARKNIGYLLATRLGADVIIETDDDNIPLESFWRPRMRRVTAAVVANQQWCNVYSLFTDAMIWPRGLPLNHVRQQIMPYPELATDSFDCPIQQGLADGDPDVDAIYRLLLPLPIHFEPERTVVLDKGVWCPFNSQNTTFWRDAFPLMYLPFYCSWRVTDIWRSLIAQRICWENDWRLMFQSATVFQDRNDHDLMIDFAEEVPGYLNNDRIRKTLEDLNLQPGVSELAANVVRCYETLISLDLVGSLELPLLTAWLSDMGVY